MIYTSSIYWSSPYPRPLNYPRVLAEQFIESDSVVTDFPELSKLYFDNKNSLPKGYSFGWSLVKPAPSVRSDAFRASIRLRNLKAKVFKRYPLFAEQFFSKELESRPEYFSGSLDAETVQFRSEINADYQKAKTLAAAGNVVVYLEWWNCDPVFQEIKQPNSLPHSKPLNLEPQLKQFSLFEFLRPFAIEEFKKVSELFNQYRKDLEELKNPLSRLHKIIGRKLSSKISEFTAKILELKKQARWLYSVFELGGFV